MEEASDHEVAEKRPDERLVIERRDSDGYFNGTNLCSAFKKKFDNYLQAKESRPTWMHSPIRFFPKLDFEFRILIRPEPL